MLALFVVYRNKRWLEKLKNGKKNKKKRWDNCGQ